MYEVREIKAYYGKKIKMEKAVIHEPKEVFLFLKKLKCHEEIQEHFYVLYLNVKNEIQNYSLVSIGTVNETIVHSRDIFRGAMLCNVSSIILAHCHPSNSITPSNEDIIMTKRMIEIGKLIGIPILDHIIIAYDKFISLRSHNGNINF